MNPFVVSQWFKYKGKLETFYKSQLGLACEDCDKPGVNAAKGGASKVCRKCRKDKGGYREGCEDIDWTKESLDVRYEGLSVSDITTDVLQNLLDYVINQGEKSQNLMYVSCSYHPLEGFCYDAVYLLNDRLGNCWMIKTFYGTYDTFMTLKGLTKQQWLTLLMHLSLGLVQQLRQAIEYVSDSLIVSSTGSAWCSLHYLIDLQGIASMENHIAMDLYTLLKNLPPKTLEPLYRMLPGEKWMPLTDILMEEDDLEDNVFHELSTINYSPLMMTLFGSQRAEKMTKFLAECGLKGFMAICSVECGGMGELHYKCQESYDVMANYVNSFEGSTYFIAYGQTLDQLLKDIEKKSREILH